MTVNLRLFQFQTFEFLTKYVYLNVTVSGKPMTDFICGGLSGAMGTVVSMPCDTIRTRLVGQGEPKVSSLLNCAKLVIKFYLFQIYQGMTHAFTTMVKHEGILSLYKGLIPSILQIMPQTGVQFASFRLFSESYWLLQGGKIIIDVNDPNFLSCIFIREAKESSSCWESYLREPRWSRSQSVCLSSRLVQEANPSSRLRGGQITFWKSTGLSLASPGLFTTQFIIERFIIKFSDNSRLKT